MRQTKNKVEIGMITVTIIILVLCIIDIPSMGLDEWIAFAHGAVIALVGIYWSIYFRKI